MNTLYISSQLVAFIAFVISLVAYHRQKKKKIFQTMMVGNVLEIFHYLLLGAYSGCIIKIMALIRNEIVVLKEKNKSLDSNIILLFLIIAYLIVGILTYKDFYSILPILAAIIYSIFIWNGDELTVKKTAFYCYFLWLVYNICVLSIVGAISNCVALVLTFIAMQNESKKKKMRDNI